MFNFFSILKIHNEGAKLGFKFGVVLAVIFIILRVLLIFDGVLDVYFPEMLLLTTYGLFQLLALIISAILFSLLSLFLPLEYTRFLFIDNELLIVTVISFFVIIICLTFYGLICQKIFKIINKRAIIISAIIFIILNSVISLLATGIMYGS